MERATERIRAGLKRFSRRWAWLAGVLLVGCSSAVLLYSNEKSAPQPRPVAAPLTSATPKAPEQPLELSQFAPYLADARFEKVKAALETDDVRVAATELDSAAESTSASEREGLLLWRGLSWERAGDATQALAACEPCLREAGKLADYAALCVARNLLATGKAKPAYEVLATRIVPSPLQAERQLVLAQAAGASGARAEALVALEESFKLSSEGASRAASGLKLVEALLAGQPSDMEARRALVVVRQVAPALVTRDVESARAASLEQKALLALPESERQAFVGKPPELGLAEIRALVDARKHEQAEQAAGALLQSLGEHARLEDRCEARLLRAKALAGARRYRAAVDALADARGGCDADSERGARAWFSSGRYAGQDSQYAEAIGYYTEVERRFRQHSLADDARFQAAVAHEELGAQARATELLLSLPDDYPKGDMAADGLFRLALRQMERGNWNDALGLLERAVAWLGDNDRARGFELAQRERHFRARAWLMLGERERALAEFEQIVKAQPLGYYMLTAYSWLQRLAPERAEAALAQAGEDAAQQPFRIAKRPAFAEPGFDRMLELLRIGEIEAALRELDALGLIREGTGSEILWAVAGLYEQAGFSKYSNALTRRRLGEVTSRWPNGAWLRPWQIAFPRPYFDLVTREAGKSAVDPALVYAVMREESAFDPEVVSAANAYGLMQLILPTARSVAKEVGIHVTAASLKRPRVNIALGCRELSRLGRRFEQNPLLAVPAYNAGPGSAQRWLRERPSLDFDLWVERIPYLETRRYTKRVLSSRAIYAFLYEPEARGTRLLLPEKVSAPAP